MIHVIKDPDGRWHVWTDTEVGEKDGRCLAISPEKKRALLGAIDELEQDIERLNVLLYKENHPGEGDFVIWHHD